MIAGHFLGAEGTLAFGFGALKIESRARPLDTAAWPGLDYRDPILRNTFS
jgi:hypothetical protein